MGRRILYIANGITGPGGLERVLSVRTRLLAEEYGDEIHIMTLNERGAEPFYDFHPGIRVHHVAMEGSSLARLAAWVRGIRKTVRTVNPDVVDVCDDGFKGFWIPLLLSGRRPVIYERHVSRMIQTEGNAPSVFMKMEFAAMRFLGGRFARFVVPASGNRAEWNMRNVEVIPNPLPFYPSVPSSGKEKRSDCRGQNLSPEKLWGLAGGLEKGAREISGLEAGPVRRGARRRQAENGDSGGGAGRKLRAASAHEGNHGGVPGASICAMSSKYEGFGMMMVEAMACGVPCVAFDCPCGPADIISHEEDGLLVEKNNIPGLANALERLMGDEVLRGALAAKAREHVRRYAAETVAEQWNRLYGRVLEEGKGGRP